MKLLLERGDVDPNSSDNNGQTPLSFAAGQLLRSDNPGGLFSYAPRYECIMRLLLQRGDIHPNLPDNNGRTPLSLADEEQQEGAVELFLEPRNVDSDLSNSNGQKPMPYAIMNGRDGAVRLFSGFRSPNSESSKTSDLIPTFTTSESASDNEVTLPPTELEPVTLHTANNPRKRKWRGEQGGRGKRRKVE